MSKIRLHQCYLKFYLSRFKAEKEEEIERILSLASSNVDATKI